MFFKFLPTKLVMFLALIFSVRYIGKKMTTHFVIFRMTKIDGIFGLTVDKKSINLNIFAFFTTLSSWILILFTCHAVQSHNIMKDKKTVFIGLTVDKEMQKFQAANYTELSWMMKFINHSLKLGVYCERSPHR